MKNNYWVRKALQLKNTMIVDIVMDKSDYEEEPFIGFVIENTSKEKFIVWLLSDEEGNGPGRWEIFPCLPSIFT